MAADELIIEGRITRADYVGAERPLRGRVLDAFNYGIWTGALIWWAAIKVTHHPVPPTNILLFSLAGWALFFAATAMARTQRLFPTPDATQAVVTRIGRDGVSHTIAGETRFLAWKAVKRIEPLRTAFVLHAAPPNDRMIVYRAGIGSGENAQRLAGLMEALRRGEHTGPLAEQDGDVWPPAPAQAIERRL